MSIRVKSVSFEDYQNTQVTAKCANFLQSAEMAKLQESQDYIEKVEALVFERDGLRVGQAIVVYKKSFRIFKKALLLHGPLLDYHSLASLTELLEALILYLRKKNIALVQELILRKEARDASVNLVLQEQFYQYIQEIVNGKEGEISSLEEAIRLTNPDFTGRIAAEGLFSIQELELLLLYAQRQMETRAG